MNTKNTVWNLYGIVDRSEQATIKLAYRLRSLQVKFSRYRNHLTFLMRCRDNKIIPKGLRLKTTVKSNKAHRITMRAGLALLRERIGDARRKKVWLRKQLETVRIDLSKTTTLDVERGVNQWAERRAEKTHLLCKERQKNKFDRLYQEKEKHLRKRRSLDQNKLVINLSRKTLSENQNKVLALGLNFATAPKEIPKKDIIARTESFAIYMKEDGQLLREGIKKCLEDAKPTKSTLNREEREAIKELKKDEDIVILPADKGNATVVMDKEQYDRKMKELLEQDDYRRIKKDPTLKLEKRIKEALNRMERQEDLPTLLKKRLSPNNSVIPQIYGLPKIHKEEVPLRPIVSTIGSATYNLAKELSRILSPLIGWTDTYLHFNENDIMVSFDVKSLFRLEADELLEIRTTLTVQQICQLTELCLKSTYFQYEDMIFEQSDGMAMGSPLSPVVANIFMEDFESTAIVTSDYQPRIWYRYVDDTFVVWEHGRQQLDEFLEHINGLHERILFTMEVEENNKISFLDVLVERKDFSIATSVYRKPTHTDRYLNYRSHHHPKTKTGIVSCLKRRAENICLDENSRIDEINRLEDVFLTNGFPQKRIQAALHAKPRSTPREDSDTDTKTLVLPYIEGLSEKITQTCRKLNVRTAFASRPTLRNILTHVKKRKQPEEKLGVIYQIPCECGAVYIGETGRTIKQRKAEHKRAVMKADPSNAVALHTASTLHAIKWEECKVIDQESNWGRRRIKEAIYIKETPNTLNTDPGLLLNPTWSTLLQRS